MKISNWAAVAGFGVLSANLIAACSDDTVSGSSNGNTGGSSATGGSGTGGGNTGGGNTGGGNTGGSATGGSNTGGASATCGTMTVPAGCANGDQLIMTHCSGCHNAQGAPQFSTIDFVTDPKTALVGKPAAYTGVTAGTCPGEKEILLDASNFDQSLFVTKVRGSGFACGALMPYPAANPLPQAEVECLVAWACGLLKD